MIPLEAEIARFLRENNFTFEDNCDSGKKLDFTINLRGGGFLNIDAKEKRQHTKMSNWVEIDVPEKDVFILDDLSARKLIKYSPLSGLIIRNNTTETYYWLDVVTLFMMPKVRVNRRVNDQGHVKGKIMLDMRSAWSSQDLRGVFIGINKYLKSQKDIFEFKTACYPLIYNEDIPYGGEYRTQEQKNYDLYATTGR